MIQEPTELPANSEPDQSLPSTEPASISTVEEKLCSCGQGPIIHACYRCQKPLCSQCTYQEEGGTLPYCRDCANKLVGVCDICDALHARPCRECSMMVCEVHQKRVIERWGWGGAPGQGGVTEWFPILRTYCEEHGQNRTDRAKPENRTFKGFDATSPEW